MMFAAARFRSVGVAEGSRGKDVVVGKVATISTHNSFTMKASDTFSEQAECDHGVSRVQRKRKWNSEGTHERMLNVMQYVQVKRSRSILKTSRAPASLDKRSSRRVTWACELVSFRRYTRSAEEAQRMFMPYKELQALVDHNTTSEMDRKFRERARQSGLPFVRPVNNATHVADSGLIGDFDSIVSWFQAEGRGRREDWEDEFDAAWDSMQQ
jgi:hypothetical protein